jgi:hypothetical protein
LTNSLPGSFDTSLSSVAITASTDSSISDSMLNQVAASGLTYEFDIFLQYNDIPNLSMVVVTWPSAWILDCT